MTMLDGGPVLDELAGSLARLPPVYVVQFEPTGRFQGTGSPEGREMLRRHYVYLFDLQARGRLFAGGPVDHDLVPGAGMILVRASSRQEAEDLARAEPYYANGWGDHRVRLWQIRSGRLVTPIQQAFGTWRP